MEASGITFFVMNGCRQTAHKGFPYLVIGASGVTHFVMDKNSKKGLPI